MEQRHQLGMSPTDGRALNCTQCAECEPKCPQSIVISELMPIMHQGRALCAPLLCAPLRVQKSAGAGGMVIRARQPLSESRMTTSPPRSRASAWAMIKPTPKPSCRRASPWLA